MAGNMNYWINVAKKLGCVLAIAVGIFLAFKLAIFYTPFLIAFIISLIMEPAIRFLMKKFKLTRKLSAIIIFILTFGIIIGSLIWGITTLISESTNLLQGINTYFEKAMSQMQNFTNSFNKIKISEDLLSIFRESSQDIIYKASVWVTSFLNKVIAVITSLPTILIYLGITIISLYFICTDKIYIVDSVEHHLPRAWVKKIGIHLREVTTTLGKYLKAELILIFISFIICLIGLYILKFLKFNIHYPLLYSLAIAFVDALPILGSGMVMVPWAVIVALDGDIKLGISIIVIWIVMCVVRQMLEPKVVGNKIGIHPIVTLIAMYTGFKIIGVMGMFIGPIILIILKNIFTPFIDKGLMKAIFDRK